MDRVEWFVLGLIAGLIIAAVVMLPVALERNKWKNVAEEQADTISRYEAITAGYEELTAELFEMLEGGNEMSVLIRGMEMPSECGYCPLCRYFPSVGVTTCMVTQATLAEDYKTIRFEGRHKDCPLVELPAAKTIDAVQMYERACRELDSGKLSVGEFNAKIRPLRGVTVTEVKA